MFLFANQVGLSNDLCRSTDVGVEGEDSALIVAGYLICIVSPDVCLFVSSLGLVPLIITASGMISCRVSDPIPSLFSSSLHRNILVPLALQIPFDQFRHLSHSAIQVRLVDIGVEQGDLILVVRKKG